MRKRAAARSRCPLPSPRGRSLGDKFALAGITGTWHPSARREGTEVSPAAPQSRRRTLTSSRCDVQGERQLWWRESPPVLGPAGTGTPRGKAEGPGGDIYRCFSAVWLHPLAGDPLLLGSARPAARRPTHPPRAPQASGLGSPPVVRPRSAAGTRGAIWWGEPGSPPPRCPSHLPAERHADPQVCPAGNWGLGVPRSPPTLQLQLFPLHLLLVLLQLLVGELAEGVRGLRLRGCLLPGRLFGLGVTQVALCGLNPRPEAVSPPGWCDDREPGTGWALRGGDAGLGTYGAAAGLGDHAGQQLRLGPSRLHVLAVLLPDLRARCEARTGTKLPPRPGVCRDPCTRLRRSPELSGRDRTLFLISSTSCGSV